MHIKRVCSSQRKGYSEKKHDSIALNLLQQNFSNTSGRLTIAQAETHQRGILPEAASFIVADGLGLDED